MSSEVELFDEMDRETHARNFVIQTGKQLHLEQFKDPEITYLSIENSKTGLCGYMILVFEKNSQSVEFRRIIIEHNSRGIGQIAIAKMESYCREAFNAKRIWLDVFRDNVIGIHIYEKMGYKRFDEGLVESRILYFYEKNL